MKYKLIGIDYKTKKIVIYAIGNKDYCFKMKNRYSEIIKTVMFKVKKDKKDE